jgi:4,5-DOPA dioxygenase extradiol
MPAAFIGHGTPMNALQHNRYTDAWAAVGKAVGRPRAVLVVSAHWYTTHSALTAMERPRTIHDFFGFPEELFAVQYPAPGDPELCAEIAELVRPTWVGQDPDSWGIDHGAWSVLVHMFPEASVPVLQLSLDASKTMDDHLDLGRRLAPLRERDVLVVASGNVVHNLRRLDHRRPDGAEVWAQRFDDAVLEVMTSSPGDVRALTGHRDFAMAAPTPDHWLPLLYLAGMAAEEGAHTETLVAGHAFGSLSMTSYTLGAVPGAL